MNALVLLAPGFEEMEAVITIDVLRRAEIATVVAAPGPERTVKSTHHLLLTADCLLDEFVDRTFDVVVLPGGLAGTQALAADPRIPALIRRQAQAGRLVAAICAAPAVILAPTGLLTGRRATCHPALADQLGTDCLSDRVVVDLPFITSQGPGTTLAFALTIVACLAGVAKARELAKGLLFDGHLPLSAIPQV